MGILDMFTQSDRLKNVLLGIINMLLLLGIFLLGHNSAIWTNEQIQTYCSIDWCNAYRMNTGIFNTSIITGVNDTFNISDLGLNPKLNFTLVNVSGS